MIEERENHTIRLLREMRSKMRDIRAEIRDFRVEVDGRFQDLTSRVDGNTIILNMLAGPPNNHDGRIATLEQDRG